MKPLAWDGKEFSELRGYVFFLAAFEDRLEGVGLGFIADH